MQGQGQYHAGGSNLQDDPELLRGVMANERERVFYPEDRCVECERMAAPLPPELCARLHWPEESTALELRGAD